MLPTIAGWSLTATKARLLLTAALLKRAALPPAAEPDGPAAAEIGATRERSLAYQAIFDPH